MTIDTGAQNFLAATFANGPCENCGRGVAYHRAMPFFGNYILNCVKEEQPQAPAAERPGVRRIVFPASRVRHDTADLKAGQGCGETFDWGEADDATNDDRPLPSIQELIDSGAWAFVNSSGGKDSDTQLIEIQKIWPRDRIIVIHADLGDVEWAGCWEHVQATAGDLPCYKVAAEKTLLGMVEKRGETLAREGKTDVSPWPSPKFRQCTSDLKRGPLEKLIRRLCREKGITTVVNCMGLRAQESPGRRKQKPLRWNKGNSKAGRDWYDFLPIHSFTVDQVFETIRAAGQEPHWAYAKGMSRLSCCFCIMASQADLKTAARLNPELLARYVRLERKLGHSMLMPSGTHGKRYLDEVTGVHVPDDNGLPLATAA